MIIKVRLRDRPKK